MSGRATLTPTQADALRVSVNDARMRDGAKVGRTTDRNLREINGRVVKALVREGLMRTEDRDGNEWAVATEEGRWWVTEEGTNPDQLVGTGEALPPLPDGAYPPDAQPLEDSPEDDPALDTDDTGEEVIQDEGAAEAGEPDAAPSTPDPEVDHSEVDDTYEGRYITAFESRILAAHRDAVRGSIPARHLGNKIVAVVVMHVDQVQHDSLADGDLQRTQKLRPTIVYPLPDTYAEQLQPIAARIVRDTTATSQSALFDDDDLDDDLRAVAERLNRDELGDRDDKGIRDFTEADRQRMQDVRDAIADGDWHPARQFGRDTIVALHGAGEVEAQPEWWITGAQPEGMTPEQVAEVIPHIRLLAPPTAAEAVDDLLSEAEAQRPQVSVERLGDGWIVNDPDDAIDGQWYLPDAAKQAAETVHGDLEWRQDGAGWIADLPVEADPDEVPF